MTDGHEAGRIECSGDGCTATVPDHRWGKTKATGWLFSRDDETAFCPDHVPEWVTAWRAEQAARHDDR